MDFSVNFVVGVSSYFSESEVKSSKYCKDCSHGQNVMKVSGHIISIVEGYVEGSVC